MEVAANQSIVDLRGVESDIPAQIDAVLSAIGVTQFEIDSFCAIYVIGALQFALSQPVYLSGDKPIDLIERFGKGLTESIAKKHPELYKLVNGGWDGVELIRIAFENTKRHQEALKNIPKLKKDLKELARNLQVDDYKKLKKQDLIDEIVKARLKL